MVRISGALRLLAALGLACGASGAMAQAVTGSLVDVSANSNFNALERAAARANQATYNQLLTTCGAGQNCTPGDLVVFQNTRELVETANELLGNGSTQFSLGLDSEGLGFAL